MSPEAILSFWLGRRDQVAPDAAQVARWFVVDPELDAEIRAGFGSTVEEALAGGLSAWEPNAKSRAALIVLLDQFPRNLHRDDARAFSGDARALELTRRTNEAELSTLHPIEHYFVLMPWMHAEDLEAQRSGVAAYVRGAEAVPAEFRAFFENGRGFAERHLQVIEGFGRFPHRNALLGRESTAEELAFLEEFGTGF